MRESLRKLSRYWHTARHLKWIQWRYRLKNVVLSVCDKRFPDLVRQTLLHRLPESIECNLNGERVSWFDKRYDGSRGMFSATDILRGRFTFLNCSKQFEDTICWSNSEFTYLWDFNLHYFEFLCALAPLLKSSSLTENENTSATITRLLDEWIDNNPFPERPAWHPYPVSLRVINWIKLFVNHGRFANANTLKCLYLQLLFLERRLEKHLLSNHLWENGRALLFGGLFFHGKDADRWARIGLDILKREAQEQILPNGGHYERSPMYHCIVLEGLLDTHVYLTAMDRDTTWLTPVISKMCRWLNNITCPDGSFPLFNDAAFGISATPDEILNNAVRMVGYKRKTRFEKVRDCDQFYVLDAAPFFCVVDGAPIGPDYNPGHAHSDNFTYELFFKGVRLIVDAGTCSYEKNESRECLRSTGSHNTVCINGVEQSEMWGGFRVARRSNPHFSRSWRDGEHLLFKGAYRNRVAPAQRITHERIFVVEPSRWILVWDTIEANDTINGRSYLRLAPDWHITSEETVYRFTGPEDKHVYCYPLAHCNAEVHTGLYAPEFGKIIPISTLTFTKNASHETNMGYLLCAEEQSTPPIAEFNREDGKLAITTSDDTAIIYLG